MKHKNSFRFVAVLIMLAALVAGCSDFERSAFKTISAAKSVIDTASEDYNAGRIEKSKANFDLLTKAQHVKDTAAQALLAYHDAKVSADAELKAGVYAPTTQQKVSATLAAAQAALADVSPLVAQLRKLSKK
ncbi:MAG: hypothetical protein JWO13_831 [Acidobacteriales bacterium]|nr:hypothetical protein [Terriglobales bacterium]